MEEQFDVKPFMPYYDDIVKNGIKNKRGKYVYDRVSNYLKLMTLFMLFPIDNRFALQCRQLKHVDSALFNIMKNFRQVLTGMKIAPENRPTLNTAYVNYRTAIEKWTSCHNITLFSA